MPAKGKEKEKSKGKGSLSVSLKDLVPAELKQTPREPRLGHKGVSAQESQEVTPEYLHCDHPEEWPGDEFAEAQDLGLSSGIQFVDNVKLQLPKSFQFNESQLIFWRRPREYLYEEILDEQEMEAKTSVLSLRLRMQNMVKNKVMKRNAVRRSTTVLTSVPRTTQDDSSPHLKKRPSKLDEDGNVMPKTDDKRKTWATETLKIFKTVMRDETPQEMEARKQAMQEKEQQQSKEQPKGKKGQPVEPKKEEEETVKKVEEVVISSMEMSSNELPQFSFWVASVFQLIKDRGIVDSFTQQRLHSKIYPQNEQGIPIYNDAGHYWIKLYHMGKVVKVEIDDKIPCSMGKNVSLFPKTGSTNELWPMLFTKALLKLQQMYMIDSSNFQRETGLGWILYSLMGLVPQNIPIRSMTEEHWTFLQQKTKDREFNNKQCFITLYSAKSFKPFLEANANIPDKKQIFNRMSRPSNDMQRTINRNTTVQHIDINRQDNPHVNESALADLSMSAVSSPSYQDIGEFKDEAKRRYRPNYTQSGFCYSVVNSLFNENFNMVYTKERSEDEIRLRENYYNLAKVNLQRMSKECKLEHRRQKKEMKEKIQIQEKERIELITGPTIQYRMLNIMSKVQKVPNLNYVSPFTEKEIYIAKKCILNKLNMPPNYDLPDLKGDDVKSVVSQSMISQMTDGSYQVKPLDDFGNLSNLIEPTQRPAGGAWVQDNDLKNAFEHIMVYYDLNKLAHYKCFDYSPENQILLIQQNVKEEPPTNKKAPPAHCQLVVSFMARRAQNKQIVPAPSFFLSKFDYQQNKQMTQYKSLNYGLIDSIYLQLENKNHVFKMNSFTPLDYCLQVSCDCAFKVMSESQYLLDYESYSQKLLNIEYSPLHKATYQLLGKYRLCIQNVESLQLFLKIKQHRLADQLRIKLVEVQENNPEGLQQNANLQEIEGVERSIMETQMLNTTQMNRLVLGKEMHYVLVVEGQFKDNISQEGQFELEMLYQAEEEDLQVEAYELNEVQEYSDIYQDNKYGHLFRERLFVQATESPVGAQVSLQLNLKMRAKQEEVQMTATKGKKVEHTQEEEKEDRDMEDNRNIYLQLLEQKGPQDSLTWDVDLHSIFKVKGVNSVLMSNVQLFPQRQYYLLAGFDLREDPVFLALPPEGKATQPEEDNIVWNLQVFSPNDQNIALVKDNSKETFENEIKKSWETQQPGRAERAAKERRKYLLKKKQINGEQLSEEELALISEQRTQRSKQQEESTQDPKAKGKAAPKKEAKKETKAAPVVEEKQEKPKREHPKSSSHQMKEINEYLCQMEKERTILERAGHPGLITLRSDEQMAELKETIQMEQEQVQALVEEQHRKRAIEAQKHQEAHSSLLPIDHSNLTDLLSERDALRKEYIQKREQESRLLELCQGSSSSVSELEKQLEQVAALKNHDKQLVNIAQKQLVNLKIQHCLDDLNEALANYELEKMNELLEYIETYSISVDQAILDKAHDIQEEANDNPNFIAEKQAEIKKGGKKGKK